VATKEDIKDAIYDDLVTVVSNNTGVSTPDEHVDVLQQREDARYPFVGFEVFGQPLDRGFDGSIHVDDVVYSSDKVDYVVYRRDTRLTVEFGVQTDDGDVHLKDQLYTAVRDHFDEYAATDNPDGLHSDVDGIDPGGFSDESSPDESVFGDRVQYQVEYSRFWNFTGVIAMETVNVDVEDLDENVVYDSAQFTA
jgi:hypothetical protein